MALASSNRKWDTIIVGQGLAGTTLAWRLRDAGQRVLIIDADEEVTSSKIAAGLITPITGKRLTLSWRYDEFLPVASRFYRDVETRTGQHFFFERTAVRLFKSDYERAKWRERLEEDDFERHLVLPQPNPLLVPETSDDGEDGFAMHAAQLDVAAYLEASRTALDYEPFALDWRSDVEFGASDVQVGAHRCLQLISCEGFAAARNPYFSWIPFNCAKGDILTVRFHRPIAPQSLHKDIWIAPTIERDIFRVGSTYDLDNLNNVPLPAAREEIESKLRNFLKVPYTVIDHRAAVRPIIFQSKAVIGLHPKQKRLGLFNGLGSKGSLLAPWYAKEFADLLVHQIPLPEEMDLQKKSYS